MRIPLLLVTVLSSASLFSAEQPRPIVGRSMVATRYGIVAASQPLAARAGVQILERGGNAIDAAIAANATIGLMEPTGNGIGGDLFAIVYEAKTGKLYGLNASGWAPSGLTPELLRAKGAARTPTAKEAAEGVTEMPQRGIYSVTVPGAVAGWDALHTRFARLPFKDLLAPAIYYAEEGFPVAEVTARGWGSPGSVRMLSATPATRARRSSSDGTRASARARCSATRTSPPRCGCIAAAGGRDGFYKGPTAEAIVEGAARRRRHDDRGRSRGVPARVGRPDLDDLSRVDRERDPATRAGHRGADDAQPDGAVPARRVRLPQPAGAARDDRGEEARLRRHAPVRRRSALLDAAGQRAAQQGRARPSARG